ncbi:MAG: galactokinase [Bdellovibrionaceae bacterium]|nr:galactokinase [Bdellovibrio sp.]
MKAPILVKSPTRVDLAGGTLDMWPLYSFLGSALTINLAIDICTHVEFKSRPHLGIKITSLDLKKDWEFSSIATFLGALDPHLHLYQKVFEKFCTELSNLPHGFEVTTSSESPIGGGLGGSSSLVISILKATYQLLDLKIPNPNELVHLAHNIEAQILKTPTGTQDYFPAVTGGLSFIDYSAVGIKQKVFPIAGTPFEDHFLLVYTGKSHQSGLNNFEVLKSCVEGDQKVLSALQKIKSIALGMQVCIEDKAWGDLPKLFQMEYDARIELTPAFSSPEIEKLAKICVAAGALAVKICGAGGGGCVLVWVPPSQRERVIQVCQNENFQCLNARPVSPLN